MGAARALPFVAGNGERSVLENIGGTPLVRLRRVAQAFPAIEVYAKAEFLNPGGSVKDRAALNMIVQGERSGALAPGRVILDASSGNTAIAYALIASNLGYRLKICMPQNASMQRRRTLEAFGVDLVLTDPAEGSDGAIRRCREIYRSNPARYFYPDQYSNPANWMAHFNATALEIMQQCRRRITHFVAALGTSGTFMGVSRRLKQDLRHVQCVSVQPSSGFHGIEGARNMAAAGIRPAIYDPGLADANLFIETEEAQRMTRALARQEGLLVGVSSGANVAAALRLAEQLAERRKRGVIVTILCDGGGRYLSEGFWSDQG